MSYVCFWMCKTCERNRSMKKIIGGKTVRAQCCKACKHDCENNTNKWVRYGSLHKTAICPLNSSFCCGQVATTAFDFVEKDDLCQGLNETQTGSDLCSYSTTKWEAGRHFSVFFFFFYYAFLTGVFLCIDKARSLCFASSAHMHR